MRESISSPRRPRSRFDASGESAKNCSSARMKRGTTSVPRMNPLFTTSATRPSMITEVSRSARSVPATRSRRPCRISRASAPSSSRLIVPAATPIAPSTIAPRIGPNRPKLSGRKDSGSARKSARISPTPPPNAPPTRSPADARSDASFDDPRGKNGDVRCAEPAEDRARRREKKDDEDLVGEWRDDGDLEQ